MKVHPSITDLLLECTYLTVAFSWQQFSYCANCFYAWDQKSGLIVFKSDSSTRHIRMLSFNPRVSGTVLPDVADLGHIRGVQFVGHAASLDDGNEEELSKLYYRKFPYAADVKGILWVITPEYFKMTDNRSGFGTKIENGSLPDEFNNVFP